MIYGFHRGTEGVAIPTLVSRMTAAIIIIVLLCDEKRTLHIERTWRYRINWEMVKKILSIGVPNGLENSMFQPWKDYRAQPGIDIRNLCDCGKCGVKCNRIVPDPSGNGNYAGNHTGYFQMCGCGRL